MIWGVHIEGPFINETPGYVGAHPPLAVRPAEVEGMKRLLEAAGGLTRLVTLAPERDPGLKVVRYLAEQGILVAAGHSDASVDQLLAAVDAGLSLFTHLGNGCPHLLPRHDNIIERALSLRDRLIPTFIGDGVHIPLMVLGNYLRLVGIDRAVVVTDAISPARLKPGATPSVRRTSTWARTWWPVRPTIRICSARRRPCRRSRRCCRKSCDCRRQRCSDCWSTIPRRASAGHRRGRLEPAASNGDPAALKKSRGSVRSFALLALLAFQLGVVLLQKRLERIGEV